MSVTVGVKSHLKFATPYFDVSQQGYVWGIADPPDPVKRADDQFYTVRSDDRLDLIASRMLGNVRYLWIIMLYNNIEDALNLDRFINKQIRLPSRATVERIYTSAFNEANNS